MTLALIFFFFASLLIAPRIRHSSRQLVFVVLSAGFFAISGQTRELKMYFSLFVLNVVLVWIFSKRPFLSSRVLMFFPLIYSSFVILVNQNYFSARVLGWSYIVLAASTHLQQALLNNKLGLRNWIKDHLFLVISFPKTSMGPIDKGVNVEAEWRLGSQRFLKGLVKVGILLFAFREYVPKPIVDTASYLKLFPYFCLGLWHYINLYLEFSGIIDLVLGIFAIWGFKLRENFNSPWRAITITDFWRRWHVTLGSWIMEHIYIPLGGNRKGTPRQIVNLLLAMTLCGLWHGPTKNFALWGLMQGLGLSIEKSLRYFGVGYEKWPRPLTWVITQTFVIFSWVIFFGWK